MNKAAQELPVPLSAYILYYNSIGNILKSTIDLITERITVY